MNLIWQCGVQVWEAIKELKTEAAWKVESIMQFATAFEAQLAAGQPHDLPALQAPKQTPVDSSLSASEVAHIPPSHPVSGVSRKSRLASSVPHYLHFHIINSDSQTKCKQLLLRRHPCVTGSAC